MPVAVWVLTLLASTAGVAIMSELLVGAVSETARGFGLTEFAVGFVIIAFVGNATK